MCHSRKEVCPKRLRTALPGNQKREMNMALKRLKEAGTKLICLPPNINFLTDLVHFCYPSPQLGKKLHHFSSLPLHLHSHRVPLASPSMLGIGIAHSSGRGRRGPQLRVAFTDFHGAKGSSHRRSATGPWESRQRECRERVPDRV